MSPATQPQDLDPVAVAAQAAPFALYPNEGHHVRGIAYQQVGQPLLGALPAGIFAA